MTTSLARPGGPDRSPVSGRIALVKVATTSHNRRPGGRMVAA
jgi:hypothetical protein